MSLNNLFQDALTTLRDFDLPNASPTASVQIKKQMSLENGKQAGFDADDHQVNSLYHYTVSRY
jgi:hypothetical protein